MKKQSCSDCAAVFFERTQSPARRNEPRIPAGAPAPSSRWIGQGRYRDSAGTEWYAGANLLLSGCTACPEKRRPSVSAVTSRGHVRTTTTQRASHSSSWLSGPTPAHRRAGRAGPANRHPREDSEKGLAFDLLSSANANVVIGHASGIITIDLAESDDAYRERMRAQLDEPYRTMLGHFRHEVGHYLEDALVFSDGERTRAARDLFGDDTKNYQAEIDRHYSEGAPADWKSATFPATQPCTRTRTLPSPLPTTCISATPSTPPANSA